MGDVTTVAIGIVFLDIGGVLYDDTVYARAWNRALREAGARFTDDEFEEEYTRARTEQSGSFRRRLVARFLPDADLRELEGIAARSGHYPPSALYEDAIPCLEALREWYRLGVIANQPGEVRSGDARDGLDRFFEVWGVSDELGVGKPDPPPLRARRTHGRRSSDVCGHGRGPARLRRAPCEARRHARHLDAPWRGTGSADARTARRSRRIDPQPRRATGRAGPAVGGMNDGRARSDILVVGAGFAGLYAAMGLHGVVADGHRVTVVNPESFFQYQPFLPEVASGTIDPRAAVVPLRRVLRHCRLVIGEVSRIDQEAREAHVRTAAGEERTIGYDIVVLAPGSRSRVLPVPGLAEYGIGFKTVQEAIYLRNHVLSQLDVAAFQEEGETSSRLTFVFVGGGYAGVEALGELEDLARDAIEYYPDLDPSDLRWVLVDAADAILPELPERLASYASDELRRRGIEIRLGARLDSAEDGLIRLSDGEAFPAETLVWTAGVKPSPLARNSGLSVPVERLTPEETARLFPSLLSTTSSSGCSSPRPECCARATACAHWSHGPVRAGCTSSGRGGAGGRRSVAARRAPPRGGSRDLGLRRLARAAVPRAHAAAGDPSGRVPLRRAAEWATPAVPGWLDFDRSFYGHGLIEPHGMKVSNDREGPSTPARALSAPPMRASGARARISPSASPRSPGRRSAPRPYVTTR